MAQLNIAACLNAISDAVNVPMEYSSDSFYGLSRAFFKPLPYLAMPLRIQASKIFMTEQVGVLFHVAGNLYLLVAYNPATTILSAFLIDVTLMPDYVVGGTTNPLKDAITKTMTLGQVIGYIRPSIVASFLYREQKWSALKLPVLPA